MWVGNLNVEDVLKIDNRETKVTREAGLFTPFIATANWGRQETLQSKYLLNLPILKLKKKTVNKIGIGGNFIYAVKNYI